MLTKPVIKIDRPAKMPLLWETVAINNQRVMWDGHSGCGTFD